MTGNKTAIFKTRHPLQSVSYTTIANRIIMYARWGQRMENKGTYSKVTTTGFIQQITKYQAKIVVIAH
ncbi:MAG: hypothetical protein IPJ81_04450 [Chitinophagaceae bacterium]|nr:hypothetical protein [Chitinophagaceae bacterium]